MRVGMLALIRPVITSTLGRWVAKIKWMPAARALRAKRAELFDLLAHHHHQIGQLVDHHHDVRQALKWLGISGVRLNGLQHELATRRGFVDFVVVARQIAHAHLAEQLVATLHFAHAPVQAMCGLLHVGDHRGAASAECLRRQLISEHLLGSIMSRRTSRASAL